MQTSPYRSAPQRSFGRSSAPAPKPPPQAGGGKPPAKPREIVKTWAFDSAGTRKYALQIQKASNGNPALLIVEGKKQEDGSYRKCSVYVWSEDFDRLFATLDEVRRFMRENNIKTPPGHKYDPNAKPKWNSRRGASKP